MKQAVKTAVETQRKMAAEEDKAALEDLKAKGMQFDAISPGTAAELRKATAGFVDEVRKRAGAELVDRVVAEAHKK